MASSNAMKAQDCTFFTLPTEVRLHIYKRVISKTEITGYTVDPEIKSKPWTSVCISRRKKTEAIAISSAATLLLVSRKVYDEARALVYSAPVDLATCSRFDLNLFGFAPHLLEFLNKVELSSTKSIFDQEIARSNPYPFSNASILLKLRSMWTGDARMPDRYLSQDYLGFPLDMLSVVKQQLEHSYHDSNSDLRRNMMRASIPRGTYKEVFLARLAVERIPLVLESEHRFGLRVLEADPGAAGTARTTHTRALTARIIWDASGISITNLPDLRQDFWWKEYVNQADAGGKDNCWVEIADGRHGWGSKYETTTPLPGLLLDLSRLRSVPEAE